MKLTQKMKRKEILASDSVCCNDLNKDEAMAEYGMIDRIIGYADGTNGLTAVQWVDKLGCMKMVTKNSPMLALFLE